MIALIRGRLVRLGDDHVVVDTGGVGYEVFCHLRTIATLHTAHDPDVTLHVHTSVSADAIRLYGFVTHDELRLFRLLIGVERIGPKAALGILGRAELPTLVRAVAEGDIALVATVPGIGRKTAERVILELRDKVGSLEPPGTHHPAATGGNDAVAAAIAGLVGLGFREVEARTAVTAIAVDGDGHDVADLVGAALRRLDSAGGRAVTDERVVSPDELEAERVADTALRPRSLDDFVGQEAIKNQVRILVEAARQRGDALDHVLLYGPPGLGKTTLAQIIAVEMGVNIRLTSGPALEHQGMLASILTSLEERDVFFIDEVHRLNRAVEEALYPAMEDLAFDFVAGKGAGAQTLRLSLNRFTVIGATTRAGALGAPLRDRFGVTFRLDFYDTDDLIAIANRSARLLGIDLDPEGAAMIARRARGTPRIVNRLLRRARDYAQVRAAGRIDVDVAAAALDVLGVDSIGLDELDRRVLGVLCGTLGGHAVGVQTIAVSVQEDPDTIEDVVEPFLIRRGLLARTLRGRLATASAYQHLGLAVPAGAPGAAEAQTALFER